MELTYTSFRAVVSYSVKHNSVQKRPIKIYDKRNWQPLYLFTWAERLKYSCAEMDSRNSPPCLWGKQTGKGRGELFQQISPGVEKFFNGLLWGRLPISSSSHFCCCHCCKSQQHFVVRLGTMYKIWHPSGVLFVHACGNHSIVCACKCKSQHGLRMHV